MVFTRLTSVTLATLLVFVSAQTVEAAEPGPAQAAMQNAAKKQQFAFVLFYRANDSATKTMYQTLESTLSSRDDAIVVPVQTGDQREQTLVNRFDAKRLPLPSVAVIAPNGAVTTVLSKEVAPRQLNAAIVSEGQATCIKALQDGQLVLLCSKPAESQPVPQGVEKFQANELYRDRTRVVELVSSDASEERFLKQLGMPINHGSTVIAFMAPPGVMVGKFQQDVAFQTLAEKLAEAGKCCDDPNCKFHK